MYSGGAVVYRSKTQLLTALSLTEAEFIVAVTAAKTAKYIRLVLSELGFEQSEPRPIYEGNKPTIDVVAYQKQTERTRHIDVCFFAIQDWIHKLKDIQLLHIPRVINPWTISLNHLVGYYMNIMQDASYGTLQCSLITHHCCLCQQPILRSSIFCFSSTHN